MIMKKLLFILLLSLLAIGLVAQTRVEEGARPARLKTDQMQTLPEVSVTAQNPLCCFVSRQIEYPESSLSINDEGIVVVQFCVNDQGEVKNIEVVNSVSPMLDRAVIDCIKKTDGQWFPAQLNGRCLTSNKKLYVSFDIEGNMPHEERAKMYYKEGLKLINKAKVLGQDTTLSIKRADRKYKLAISRFERADKFAPDESSFAFWKAFAYERMGNMTMMKESLERYNELISGGTDDERIFVTISSLK